MLKMGDKRVKRMRRKEFAVFGGFVSISGEIGRCNLAS